MCVCARARACVCKRRKKLYMKKQTDKTLSIKRLNFYSVFLLKEFCLFILTNACKQSSFNNKTIISQHFWVLRLAISYINATTRKKKTTKK